MTKEEFLKRCENAWSMGLCTPDRLRLLDRWLDFVMRLEGGQLNYVADILEAERERTGGFHSHKTLAGDADGYALVRLSAILNHACQMCAEDENAWHTRGAFCEHKKVNSQQREIEPELKCPHCGKLFYFGDLRHSLIPTHDFPEPCRAVCPGSKQHARSIYDRRTLWKDEDSQQRRQKRGRG